MSDQEQSARRIDDTGALVVSNRVEPGIPENILNDFLDEGIVGLTVYDNTPSLDPDNLDTDNRTGRGSVSDLEKFSRVGGYILAHRHEGKRIIVGRARPGCLRIDRVKHSDGGETVLKSVQLAAYADIEPNEFTGIHDIATESGLTRHTFTGLDEDKRADHIEQIVAAVTTLEREGRLNYR